MSRLGWACVAACGVVVIGSVLPWATNDTETVLGIETNGRYTAVFGIGAGIQTAIGAHESRLAYAFAAIMGLIAAGIACLDLFTLEEATAELGLYLTAIAGLGVAIAARSLIAQTAHDPSTDRPEGAP